MSENLLFDSCFIVSRREGALNKVRIPLLTYLNSGILYYRKRSKYYAFYSTISHVTVIRRE